MLFIGKKGGMSLILRLPISAEQGDYNITAGGFNATLVEGLITQDADNGSLTILNHDTAQKTLKGIFEFKVGSTEITQGIFEVKYWYD